MGLYILEYYDCIYIIDYLTLDQLHQISKMWEGFYKYANNYRLTGMENCQRELNSGVLDKCVKWLCEVIIEFNFSDKIAGCMKQSLALLRNDIHPSAERLNVNLESKSAKLKLMIKEVLQLTVYWHEFLRSLGISDRVMLI